MKLPSVVRANTEKVRYSLAQREWVDAARFRRQRVQIGGGAAAMRELLELKVPRNWKGERSIYVIIVISELGFMARFRLLGGT
jgi:hypothetical protein